jgi:hypothetical protein
MTGCAFLHTNLAAGLTPTGTSTAPVTGLGFDKLNDPQPRHRVRFAAAACVLVWDFLTAQSVDCLALLSTTLPTAATVRIRASTLDPTCVASVLYDSGVQATVTTPIYNGNVVACFAAVSARYWRIDIAGANDPIDIGLAPLGLLFRPSRNFQYGAQEGVIDLSTRDTNPDTGAAFGVSGPKLRTKIFTIQGLTKSEVRTDLAAVDLSQGASGDVLFVEDPDATFIERARDSIYGSYRQMGPDLATRIGAQVWARSFRLTERL